MTEGVRGGFRGDYVTDCDQEQAVGCDGVLGRERVLWAQVLRGGFSRR